MTDNYDFVQLGERLAKTLLAAAEEQVAKAQHVLDQTRTLAEILHNQVAAQAKAIEEMNTRFKSFGEAMLDAHRMLEGNHPSQVAERVHSDFVPNSLSGAARDAAVAGLRAAVAVGKQGSAADHPDPFRGNSRDPNGLGDLRRKVEASTRDAANHGYGSRPRPDSSDADPTF